MSIKINNNKLTVPKIVFIVPYRARPQHKFFFSNYLTSILSYRDDYEIYFSHQCDIRAFNRGATKNIGFLAIKDKYPDKYKDITFVFNDIDTIPFSTIFDYETTHGIIKHFYGFKYALGGIVSIKGSDFEATNGFPNFWGWGMEDNVLQKRCEKIGLHIDRSNFYPIGSPEILQLFDGVSRIINKKDPWRATHDDGVDGLQTVHKLIYTIDSESRSEKDNIHIVHSNKIFIINIDTFMTGVRFEHDNYYKYDLREPPRKIIHPDKVKTNKIELLTDDWTNIPYYPTSDKKEELVKQYGKEGAQKIIEYNSENSKDPTKILIPPNLQIYTNNYINKQNNNFVNTNTNTNNNINSNSNTDTNTNTNPYQVHLHLIQKYNESMRQANSNNRLVPQNINKYSPDYAKIIAAKPRASVSANIRLGGVYK
jgi:hypothetical protein